METSVKYSTWEMKNRGLKYEYWKFTLRIWGSGGWFFFNMNDNEIPFLQMLFSSEILGVCVCVILLCRSKLDYLSPLFCATNFIPIQGYFFGRV